MIRNDELSLLLAAQSADEREHRRRALQRASRAAMFWPEEAAVLVEAGRPLTGLRAVGPWVAERITRLLEGPRPNVEADELRRDFLTVARAREVLAEQPGWTDGIRGDLQMHTTHSDGTLNVADMLDAASAYGYEYVAITDHSKSLAIAGGMDEAELAAEGDEIDAINAQAARDGPRPRALKGIEMDVFDDGTADMDPAALRRLDVVLGAFHTKLRERDDRTGRYLAALRNPDVHVLAHPRTRKYGRRAGLVADWPAVFAEAARLDKALEIDASPDRQDLNVELLRLAAASGVRISIGTDAHHPAELAFVDLGLAAAAIAGVPRGRILNFAPVTEVLAWTAELRDRASR